MLALLVFDFFLKTRMRPTFQPWFRRFRNGYASRNVNRTLPNTGIVQKVFFTFFCLTVLNSAVWEFISND